MIVTLRYVLALLLKSSGFQKERAEIIHSKYYLHMLSQELNARKHENMQLEYARESNNDLLEYLRSLESEMVMIWNFFMSNSLSLPEVGFLRIWNLFQQVTELSRPSSIEVEEIIHQLVQNVLRKFFKDDSSLDFMGDSAAIRSTDLRNGDDECCNTIGTSRDYLAKLIFWLVLCYMCFSITSSWLLQFIYIWR